MALASGAGSVLDMATASADGGPGEGLALDPGPAAIVRATVAALAIGMLGAALVVVLGWRLRPPSQRPTLLTWCGLTGAWLVAGLVLARRAGRRRMASLLLAGSALGAASMVSAAVWSAGWRHGWPATFDEPSAATRALGAAVVFHVALALPDGELRSLGRRLFAVAGYGLGVAFGAYLVIHGRPFPTWERFVPPATIAAGASVAAWYVRSRYVGAKPSVRRRLQWFSVAGAAVLALGMATAAGNLLLGWPRPIGLVMAVSTALLPVALITDTTALARRADRAAVRALTVAGWTAVVSGALLLFVAGLVHRPQGSERTILAATLVAVAAVGLGAPGLRVRLSESAQRLVYGNRHPADEALVVLSGRLSRTVPLDELLRDVTSSLALSQGATAEIWTTTAGGALDLTSSAPARGQGTIAIDDHSRAALLQPGVKAHAWAHTWLPALIAGRPDDQLRLAPVIHDGDVLGLAVTCRSSSAEPFSARDDEILAELARQLGVALHNARLDAALTASLAELRQSADELRASRARIVAAADAERRRIERDLHDGAQQRLVALAVSLGVTRDVLEADPAEATTLIDELRGELQLAIDDLRALAHGIYPPLLADQGLPEALRAAARGRQRAAVRAADVGRHSQAVEAAVYFCCLEALQNAAKHAPHANVELWLDRVDGWLCFEVADDGPGFDGATVTAGHGRTNMADRIGAVGGSVEWTSAPGVGTTVSGRVPVGPGAGPRPSAERDGA